MVNPSVKSLKRRSSDGGGNSSSIAGRCHRQKVEVIEHQVVQHLNKKEELKRQMELEIQTLQQRIIDEAPGRNQ